MNDKLSIDRLEKLHPKVKKVFQKFIEEAELYFNITLRISQGVRTIEEQNALYALGRTVKGKKVTNAVGGKSYHNYCLAIDVVQLVGSQVNWDFDYSKLKLFAHKYNIEWGGDWQFQDKPHFQITLGYTINELFEKYNKKDFIPGTQFLNL